MNKPNTLYVDRFGLVRVPLLPGQTPIMWEGLGFDYDQATHEVFRSVDRPHNTKRFSPAAWLESSSRKFELFGGSVETRRIERRETNARALADHYWELQNRCRWPALSAWEHGWEDWQYYKAIVNAFGIENRAVKAILRRRAEDQWRAWNTTMPEASLAHGRVALTPAG
jgi:hypothetical protein